MKNKNKKKAPRNAIVRAMQDACKGSKMRDRRDRRAKEKEKRIEWD